MTLEQYAYLAEVVGVVLVIASLVYVARQLRQNTNMMRVNAASEWLQRDYNIAASVIDSREFAEIWTKGGLEFETLDAVDQQRAMLFERRPFGLWHQLFNLRKQNLLPDSTWQEHIWVIQNLGSRQSTREAWRVFKDAYEKPFQEFVENQFAIADGVAAESGGRQRATSRRSAMRALDFRCRSSAGIRACPASPAVVERKL